MPIYIKTDKIESTTIGAEGQSHRSIVRDGLVLYLDAADSDSYTGSGTTWYDLSGNGFNATLKNSPTYSTNNLGRFSLDGTNDYAYVGATFPSYTNFTVSFWVNVQTIANHRGIFCIKNAADTADYGSGNFAIHTLTDGYFGMEASDLYAGNTSKNNTIVYNTNAYCTVVCDQTNSIVRYYLNGYANGTQAITSTITFSDHTALFIGSRQYSTTGENSPQNTLTGYLYHLLFYQRVLSQTEIYQNYISTKDRFNLGGYYNCGYGCQYYSFNPNCTAC
jgi:hypothetical protein